LGAQTVNLLYPPGILSSATIVGKKESEGPLGEYFDEVMPDSLWGEKSWEKAECKMFQQVAEMAMSKANKKPTDINYLFGGDLLNQIIAANFAARALEIPFFGMYGACSTLVESLSLAAMLIGSGCAKCALCVTTSHFCTAERQYRYPLELGTQRCPTAQWTVTGAGGFVLDEEGSGPYITHVTTGKVIDYGIKDITNMGAAMAPAAADTINAHFKDTGRTADDYDLIVTGDLGRFGGALAEDLLMKAGHNISGKHIDCGCEIFSLEQDVQAGGSGCGCCAIVFGGYILCRILDSTFKRVLLLSTGALLSPVSSQQGESIPGIAHAVCIQKDR
jgi:stage V sporulation protein AD